MAWNPPEGVDLDEVIEVAEEMGYLPDKSGQEYIDHLREDTDELLGLGDVHEADGSGRGRLRLGEHQVRPGATVNGIHPVECV